MKQRGFTIVELLVVIIIMAILLTLAVVNVRSTQIQARDNERRVDTENIAKAMESFYGDTHQIGSPSSPTKTYPSRPGVSDTSPSNWIMPYLEEKTPLASFYAPGADTEGAKSLVVATNTNTNPASVAPQPTVTTYVYQPLQRDGNLCDNFYLQLCVTFNLYYKLEQATDECPAAANNVCVIRSKHQ